jgi:cobalt/nickel transport system ATP-binding protein
MDAISISNLNFSYPGGKRVLNSISLNIKKGEKVGIAGANGAGKSTLIYHFNGVMAFNKSISINGLPIIKKHIKKIRRDVGLVFQNPDDQLFSTTLYDDIAFGLINSGVDKRKILSIVKKTLDRVGLHGFKDRSAIELSMGEKKRAAIATVLAMEPSIMILDEPVAALDPRGRRQLIKLLSSLDVTMIIVSHDLSLIKKLCSRMIIMDKGKITADSTPTFLLNNKELLKKSGLC